MEFTTENCRFETYPADYPGVKGSMVGFPFVYFDAIIPYLLDKTAVFLLLFSKNFIIASTNNTPQTEPTFA